MFSQRDPRWGDKQLGKSGLKMKDFGCVVTNVAQAMNSAGHDIDPGRLVDRLNEVGGFTDNNHPQGGGLLIWSKVSQVMPAFHYNSHADGRYNVKFVQGIWGRMAHWLLSSGDNLFDPFYGQPFPPKGYRLNGVARMASIDPAPKPEPAPQPQPQPTNDENKPSFWTVRVRVPNGPNGYALKVRTSPEVKDVYDNRGRLVETNEVKDKRLKQYNEVEVVREVEGQHIEYNGYKGNKWLLTRVSVQEGNPRYIWEPATERI